MTKTGLYIFARRGRATMVPLTMVLPQWCCAAGTLGGCADALNTGRTEGPLLDVRPLHRAVRPAERFLPHSISPVVTMEACEYMGIPNCCIAIEDLLFRASRKTSS